MVVFEAGSPRGIVLFAAGAGGDPRRYSTLLEGLARGRLTVLAPTSPRLDPRNVTGDQLRERAAGLRSALAEHADERLPVTIVGHSIGGAAALSLAGAVPWGRDAQPIPVPTEGRVTRVVLLAPSLGWFGAPGALSKVRVPIEVFAGAEDVITPPETTEVLHSAPGPVQIDVDEHVGHFDCMTELPPGETPARGAGHGAFLEALAARVAGS
ncbi:alpha/beta fold hydrolase [Patulibacter sp. NPDC049589]|uniref:alpha/beta fold hydrolase n=1 Tax=Patulibacter sp. NPDC049589 TaxID=3154731 RepID=UPI003448A447